MSYRFHGGVHPNSCKTLTSDRPVKRAYIPKKVIIPLSQHVGLPAEPLVKAGDDVRIGQVIGKPAGFISSFIHASISGRVTSVSPMPTPTLSRSLSVTIESRETDDPELKAIQRKDIDALSKEELLNIIKDSGIVGLGGAAFPAHVKLSPPKDKPIDSVILNGVECEPYITCDHRLMIEKTHELLKGLEIIKKIVGAKDAYIAIEDNKLSAIYAMGQALRNAKYPMPNTRVVTLHTKYPQGAEKQVIKSVLNRVVPAGGLPMDIGCIVQNVATVFAIYEAVYLGKPLIERAITLTGSALKEPVNIIVRVGTILSDLMNYIGPFASEPRKVIVGGPMMGVAQYTLDIPIIKGAGGILFLSKEDLAEDKEGVCIRCGKCIDACPMELVPTTLMNLVKIEHFTDAKDNGISNCYECGACAYDCPAKIPLVDYMKFGKAKI